MTALNMQQIESPLPRGTIILESSLPTPSIQGQHLVTGLTTGSLGLTRTDSESTFSFGSGSVFSSEDLLCDGDAQDYHPAKNTRTSSSDSVSTIGFGMATFSSQDLMYLDYTTSKNESENAQAKTIHAALSCKRDSYL